MKGSWTRDPPTAPGFYWYRDDYSKELSVVEGPDEHGCWLLLGDDRLVGHASLLAQGGEWFTAALEKPET